MKQTLFNTTNSNVASLPKVIWEEGRVAALSDTYATKSPLVTMARPKFAPKSTSSRGPIPKPHYLPHPWTRPTYDAKRLPDPIRRFSTIHWTDRPTDRPRESLTTIGLCAPRAMRPNNKCFKLRRTMKYDQWRRQTWAKGRPQGLSSPK